MVNSGKLGISQGKKVDSIYTKTLKGISLEHVKYGEKKSMKYLH